ncbi:MAG: electron transport complex subunit RsxC [Limnochordia bacterium]|jgi:electron transport complex protein RnfC|nr:electron transport complex subunit RsxC [Limnochordia bacterium]
MQRTFPRGGNKRVPDRKEATEHKAIRVMPAPSIVVIPMVQHIGAPCGSVVRVGDKVKVGQPLGEAKAFVCAPVHASVSGEVIAVEERPLVTGAKALAVVIRNDGNDEMAPFEPGDLGKMSPDAIRQKVKAAGIVGMGGAGFPTHIKLNPPKAVDTILINGAECEPYLTCDHRLMVEQASELVGGLLAIMKATGASRGVIGIEENKPDAIATMQEAIKGLEQLSVAVLNVKYPQGAEKQLVKAILDKEIPSGCLPADVGCVIQNVHTAIAVHEAVTQGKPLYERVVTVSGGAVVDPRNLLVRIGTPIQSVLDYCGGLLGEPAALISGGPMTGRPIVDRDGPVVKTSSGISALNPEEAGFDVNRPCIRCSRCLKACPMGLTPNLLGQYSDKGLYQRAKELRAQDCIECGLCSYVCPSKRALVTWIKKGKAGIAAQRAKESELGVSVCK